MSKYIVSTDNCAYHYLFLIDTIEELEIKSSKGCKESKLKLEEIKKQISFYELCRKNKIYRYIAKQRRCKYLLLLL